jgi:hypothetical protein
LHWGFGVEQIPAALCRGVDRILVTRDKMVEGQVEQHLRPFVGRDRADQVSAIGSMAEDLLKGLPIFLDCTDPGRRGV